MPEYTLLDGRRVRPATPAELAERERRVREVFSSSNTVTTGTLHSILLCTGHTNLVFALAITPDGTTLVSGSADRTIRRWNMATGAAIGEPLTGDTNWVRALAITPDGTRIIASASPGDATLAQIPYRGCACQRMGPEDAPRAHTLAVYEFRNA